MTFKGIQKTLQQAFNKWEKATTSTSIVLRRSDQQSSFQRSTYNDEALFDIPEIDIISRRSTSSQNSRNTLLKALESR
ncbi:hypothetical protein EJD97_008693, partial [Solanum chilense]